MFGSCFRMPTFILLSESLCHYIQHYTRWQCTFASLCHTQCHSRHCTFAALCHIQINIWECWHIYVTFSIIHYDCVCLSLWCLTLPKTAVYAFLSHSVSYNCKMAVFASLCHVTRWHSYKMAVLLLASLHQFQHQM